MTRASRRRLEAILMACALVAGLVAISPVRAEGQELPEQAPFLVGAATANADVPVGTCLGGYDTFCKRASKGMREPLTTAAIAISGAGGGDLIIAKATAIGLFAAYKDELGKTGIYDIRQRISQRTGIPADHVIVTSDHSHAAPDTIGIWGGVSRAYMEKLADSIVDAAAQAYLSRLPADISVGAVTPSKALLDSSYDEPPTDNSAMDEEFRILVARTPGGETISTLVNYAPHATACGECGDLASGDWTAWAAQEIAARGLGTGIGFVGALGSTDWGKNKSETGARERLNGLLDLALGALQPVEGNTVDVELTFIREQLAQPVLLANALPGGTVKCPPGADGFCNGSEIRIDRDVRPPWLTGSKLGTYVGAVRVGDLFMSTIPGEPFPQVQDALTESISGASEHFMLGAANDFLGYMVADDDQYRQTLQEGAAYLGGCPEEEVMGGAGVEHDGACPDHWTLMVSPTMGRHAVCTAQNGAENLGFEVTARDERCAALTALDGKHAPPENDGGSEPEKTVKAGVARVEATWHLGASGGQFADTAPPFDEENVDPYMHSTKKKPAYGQGSRVDVRALVVEGSNGEQVAIVSHDLYLPNDFLTRRIGTLVERATGIPASNVMVTASHNHNSAFYSTPSWGTWIFQDVFDLRFYEYMAEKGALAVEKAFESMVPARVGGGTSEFNEITSHTYGPKVADDGTPAGQPYDHTTGELTVVSFDDISGESPEPLATWVVFGVHPEWTWGYDLLNGDIGHATMRITDREIGGMTVWSGREIGASGPHKDTRAHGWEERREYQDNGFAEMDRAARLLADEIEDTRLDVASGDASELKHFSPLDSTFDVDAVSQRFAPPTTRPHPGVSNCNTASLFHGDPRIPVLGLPDCAHASDPPDEPTGQLGPVDQVADEVGRQVIDPVSKAYSEHTAPMYDQLKQAGVPIPESYSATKLTGVEETAAVHLMAIKLGGIGITVCPCEQFTDTALNIQSRIDDDADNLYVGFSWTDIKTPSGRDWCVQNADETWSCANPQSPTEDLPPISDIVYRRFVAQIKNDAKGWEIDDMQDPESDVRTLGAEAEPWDPAKIKGNFTHEEFPEHGYALPISVGMGNDYWGYVPEYREMRSHDHYRKALNGLGPHGADFLATRLSRLAVSLNGGPGVPLRALDVAYQAESARAQVLADGLGELADAYEKAYRPTLPKDGGDPRIVSAPDQVERFNAFNVTWVGGSTYADMPSVVIERRNDQGEWEEYGDTSGDVQLMADFPNPEQIPGWRAGQHQWTWTATFEAFGSEIQLPDLQGTKRRATPAGDYRVVIQGQRRSGEPRPPQDCEAMTKERCVVDSLVDYELVKEFEIVPWDGIVARDLQVAGTDISFEVAGEAERLCGNKKGDAEPGEAGPIDLPDSYDSSFPFIRCEWRNFGPAEQRQSYCSFCTFRPWADTSRVTEAWITIDRAVGDDERVPATLGADGRWHASGTVYDGDKAFVAAGDVVDEYGNLTGSRSNEQIGTEPRPTPTGSDPDEPTATLLSYEGDSAGQYSDETRLAARLTDASGSPVGGQEMVFELTGAASERRLTATTDETGLAVVTPRLSETPGAHQLTVRFAGNDRLLGSADSTVFVVEKEDTTLNLAARGKGKNSSLEAHLFDSDSAQAGVGGADLEFFADGEPIGSATTDPGGRATLALPSRYRGGKHTFEAVFRGNDFYEGSTGTARP